ncbi:MAG: peptidylprolyl isomerase [Candidatus Komeilibacteria bacterium]|nr:peptidylprolyl isomerase [Candidatus Komeilibacteria bacterium]
MTTNTFHSVNRRQVWLAFVIIVIVAVFCALAISPKVPDWMPLKSVFNRISPHLGLDLQGGSHLVYQADLSKVAGARADAMQGVRDVIERRVNSFGVSEPLVQTAGQDRLIVDLAGIQDVNQAIKLIGETPLLEFKEKITTDPKVTEELNNQMTQANAAAKKKAEDILGRAKQGEDFAALAKQFSEDPGSKDKGGDLGFVKKGAFVPEFDKAIFQDLQVGQVDPNLVESNFGYHIIQKLAERGEGDNKEVNSRHILIAKKQPPAALQDQWSNTSLSGKYLESAQVQFDPNSGSPEVSIKFNAEGKDLFAAITKANVGKPVAIFLDGQLISQPTVQEEITQGQAVISGRFGLVEAKTLAQRLNAGALPVPISLISQQTIGPTLGKVYLEKSLIAGLIGFLAVALFMIIFYRLMGIIAVLALSIYAVVALTIFQVWPITFHS